QRARRTPRRPHHPEADRGDGAMNEQAARTTRHIPDRLGSPVRAAIFSWATLLLCVAIALFIADALLSPNFLKPSSLAYATYNFSEKALIALAMALLIIAGEIDLSVAAIMALASTLMGLALQYGVGTPGLVAIGVLTGV